MCGPQINSEVHLLCVFACLLKKTKTESERKVNKQTGMQNVLHVYLFTGKLGNCHLVPEKTKVCFPGEIFMGGTCTFQGNRGF